MTREMKQKIGRSISMMLVFLLLFGCINWNACVQVNAAPKAKTRITLNEKSISTYVGGKVKLKVKSVTPKKISKKVKWTTSNKRVATVSNKGVVKGKKTGKAKITATLVSNSKVKASCMVKVYKATKKLKLTSRAQYTLKVGESATASAKVIKPKKGAQPVSWSSQNQKVATVSKKGVINAVAAGVVSGVVVDSGVVSGVAIVSPAGTGVGAVSGAAVSLAEQAAMESATKTVSNPSFHFFIYFSPP